MSHELKGNLNNAINLNGSMQSSGNLRGQFQLGGGGGGTTDYNDLSNKPSINGHTLQGDSDTSDLALDYEDLLNLPVIPDMSGYYDKTEVDDLLEDKADKSQINYIWPAGEGNVVAQVDLIFDDETQEWVPTVTNINIPLYYSVTEMNALLEDKADTDDLSDVAFSGDYDDLINKPVIPSGTNYSLTEHKIGTWHDGSDIYEITVILPSAVDFNANSSKLLTEAGWTIPCMVIDVEVIAYTLNSGSMWYQAAGWWGFEYRVGTGLVVYNGRNAAAKLTGFTLRYVKL